MAGHFYNNEAMISIPIIRCFKNVSLSTQNINFVNELLYGGRWNLYQSIALEILRTIGFLIIGFKKGDMIS